MNCVRRWALFIAAGAFVFTSVVGIAFSWRHYGRLPGPRTDHFEQANHLAQVGQAVEALELYRQYTEAMPDSVLAWYNLATLQQSAGEWMAARRSWKEALVRG